MSNLNTIVTFLRGKGLSDVAIAGIVGNLTVESNLSPEAFNNAENAIGLAQWEGGRRTALQAFARQHGGTETDLNIQLAFLWHELSTQYTGVLHELKTAKTAAQAAKIWDVGSGGQGSGTGFENSAGTATFERQQLASSFYSNGTLQKIKTTGVSPAASGGGTEPMTRQDFEGIDNLGSLLDSVPELRNLVDKAVHSNWTTDKFENAVEDSAWWKTHSQTARSAIIQRANDPASWNQTLVNTAQSVRALARQLGFAASPAQINAIANHALLTGNDSNQQWLTGQLSHIDNYAHVDSLSGLSGSMAQVSGQIQQLAADYGMNWNASQIANRAQMVVSGQTTIDTFQNNLKEWAKSAFPSLAKAIDAGQTVAQLADPYVTSMSQLLEVDPGTLNVYTPLIRKAMQGNTPAGAKPGTEPSAMPLWQFEQQVRADPRWQHTQGARDTMASALLNIGSKFGFGPTG